MILSTSLNNHDTFDIQFSNKDLTNFTKLRLPLRFDKFPPYFLNLYIARLFGAGVLKSESSLNFSECFQRTLIKTEGKFLNIRPQKKGTL